MIDRAKFSGKKILVTGGVGFVGSNLARRLVELGGRLTLVDSLVPEYGGNLFNIAGLEDKITLNISDVRDEHSMRYLIQDQDYLFNLAGQTSHMDSMVDPQTDLEINCRAQLSILEACRKYNPKVKIVFASTRQIYGKPAYVPVDEKHLLRPTDVNGVNKMAGEAFHILYNNVHGIRACALRLTNTIGPGMRIKDARQTFLGIWIRLLLEEKPFEVWEGDQLRDFTYIDDAVNAFLLAAASDQSEGQIYNLGGGPAISLRDLAELLVKANGRGKFSVRPYPPDRQPIDIGDYYADFRLIKSSLGWEPTVPLSQALELTLSYYKKNLPHYV
jgi:UDP-glucose 4-epimerase